MARASAHPITDHEEIRRWAEQRGAKPTCVRNTGDEQDVGMIRLDFPGYTGENSLQEISWDDWFQKFDEGNLSLLVQDETAGGEQSNFNKLVSRGIARGKETGTRKSARSQSGSKGKQGSRASGSRTQRSRASADTRRSSSRRQSSSRAGGRTSSRNSSSRRAGRSTTSVSARGKKASTTARGKKGAASSRGNRSRRRAA